MITAAAYDHMLANPGTHQWSKDSEYCVTYNATDKYFHLFGPRKSHHQLYGPVTNLDRLNAHWSGFSQQ